MKDKIKVGIDLGGSHVAIGVVNEEGALIEQHERDFTKKEKEENLIVEVAKEYIVKIILYLKDKYNFTKFGIGVPGTISEGVILKSVNLGIEKYKIKEQLEKATGLEVKVKNDAKCAAIAEYKYGEAKKYKNVLFLTLGTGIGGAYIYQGELMEGSIFEGLEFGHMIIKKNGLQCKCGKKGCFEKYASILVFKNKVIERLNLPYDLSGPELRKIMNENSEKIEDIKQEYIKNLSIGLSNLINILEPDAIVIGGGFARYDYMLLDRLKDALLNSNLLFNERKNLDLLVANLGNDAGIIGASLI